MSQLLGSLIIPGASIRGGGKGREGVGRGEDKGRERKRHGETDEWVGG